MVNELPLNFTELIMSLPAPFSQIFQWIGFIIGALGLILIIYVINTILNFKKYNRMKKMDRKLDFIMSKLKIKYE